MSRHRRQLVRRKRLRAHKAAGYEKVWRALRELDYQPFYDVLPSHLHTKVDVIVLGGYLALHMIQKQEAIDTIDLMRITGVPVAAYLAILKEAGLWWWPDGTIQVSPMFVTIYEEMAYGGK